LSRARDSPGHLRGSRSEDEEAPSEGSSADGGAEGVSEGLAEALNVGFVFGFDHDPGELLGAGISGICPAPETRRGIYVAVEARMRRRRARAQAPMEERRALARDWLKR